jgi:hypothetical protein
MTSSNRNGRGGRERTVDDGTADRSLTPTDLARPPVAATAHRSAVPASRRGDPVCVAATVHRRAEPAGRPRESVRVVAVTEFRGEEMKSRPGEPLEPAGGAGATTVRRREVSTRPEAEAVRRGLPSSTRAGCGTHVCRMECRCSDRPGPPARHPMEWSRAWMGSAEASSRTDRAAHRCRRDPRRPTRCSASSRAGRRRPRALRSRRGQLPTWLPRAPRGEGDVCVCGPSSAEVGAGSRRRAPSRHGVESQGRPEVPVPAAGRSCPAGPRRRHAPARAGHRRRRLPTGRRGGRGRSSSRLALEVASERSDAAMLQGFHRSR